MKFLKRLMISTALVLVTFTFLVYLFLQQGVFGANPATTRLERITQSKNYRDGSFQNLSPTEVTRKGVSPVKMVRDYVNKSSANVPASPLPSVKTDLNALSDTIPTVVGFGHSS